jgi:hypothetical protein
MEQLQVTVTEDATGLLVRDTSGESGEGQVIGPFKIPEEVQVGTSRCADQRIRE